MSLMRGARELLLDLVALVWPTSCLGCGTPDRELCASCAAQVCLADPGGLDGAAMVGRPCFAAGPYAGVTRAALIAFKHRGSYRMARVLGAKLAGPLALALAGAGPTLVTTIPSRRRRVRERGYRHVEVMVRAALRGAQRGTLRDRQRVGPRGGGTHVALVRALRPLRGRTGQVGLSAREREQNAMRLAVRRPLAVRGRQVVLVDDILTTGASARAAIAELERAGAHVIAVVFLCISARRDTRGQ